MKSKVAHTLKSLTSKLHGPLPLTPRSSQQLLSKLNASFKEQFDRQHLPVSQNTEEHANLHLQSILKDPLFDAKPPTRETSTSKTKSIGQTPGQPQNHKTQVLDAFRERASQGTVDLKMAKLCLSVQYAACMTSCDATPRQAMQTSGAGSTILQWLWSSGMEDAGLFLDDRHFVDMLVAFLVAEGQQSRISRWLQRCHRLGERPFLNISEVDASRIAKRLFHRLIRQEIRIGDGLESAIDLFLRTVADLRSVGFEGMFMTTTSKYAAWEVVRTILDFWKFSEPRPPCFHAFEQTVRSMTPSAYFDACLGVSIQEKLDPQPALTWFQSSEELQQKIKHPRQRIGIVLLGLRAAEIFLKDGRQKETLWIMEFLRVNFKPELGLTKSREPRAMLRSRFVPLFPEPECLLKNEERNLQLLDTLIVH